MTDAPAPPVHRLERLRTRLDDLGLDALLITAATSRRWVSGFTGSAGVLLVGATAARIATDGRYEQQAGLQCPHFELVPSGRGQPWLAAAALFAGLGGKRVGFEPAALTVAEHDAWTQALDALPDADRPAFVAAPRAVETLRMVKEPAEIDALQRAVTLGDEAWRHAFGTLAPGQTERSLAWEFQRYALEHGAQALSFPTIIAGGPWGALPHAQPREAPLPERGGVVMDLGVIVDGYCSDLTRTIHIGEPDARFREIYDIVLTAQQTAIERAEAGMTGEQVHGVAAAVIDAAGYGDRFTHGLGHGVGIEVHELPNLRPGATDPLEDGHVVTVEPGIYIEGWGGVRIEDQCVMRDGRLHSLTAAPKLDLEVPSLSAPAGAMRSPGSSQ